MEDNIFDTAKKIAQAKKEKANNQPSNTTAPKIITTVEDPQISLMLEKMRVMKEDLENQLSSIYQKGKESKINVAILVDNIHILSPTDLAKVREQEKVLTDKIVAITPPESCLRKKTKNKEKLTQERKGKMRGSRNQWIPVR